MTPPPAQVHGYCPMGCGETLYLAAGACVTCAHLDCPRPDAVTELLADRETEHIVVFDETQFTVRHPLQERLDDALMECQLHRHIAAMAGPPVKPGRYRARLVSDDGAIIPRWTWQATS